jgi:hypothetical protein
VRKALSRMGITVRNAGFPATVVKTPPAVRSVLNLMIMSI